MKREDIPAPIEKSYREERRLGAWILLVAVSALAAMAAPFFLGRVYVADDLGEFHLPLRNFYAGQLKLGEPFDWMSSLYGGFHVAAEGQMGAYHPLHLLLYRCLPLGAAFDLELLASYPFLFAGMFSFLRRLLGRIDAAAFGALAFTFCGFNLLHFVHPNAVAIIAHLPWLLLAIETALTGQSATARASGELAIALLTASQLLLGYPQYVWFSLLIETAYVVWRSIEVRPGRQALFFICMALTLGMMCSAIQWIPTVEALADSVRRQPDAEFANSGSLHPLNLIQFLAPYLFETRVVGQNTHELGLYAGAAPVLLCLWLATQRRKWGQMAPYAWASFVLGGFGLLLAMGQFGVVYRLQTWLPFVNRFRFPCRAIAIVHFAIAIGAATALTLLVTRSQQRVAGDENSGLKPLAAAFLLSVMLAVVGPLMWPQYVASWILIACGPVLMGLAAALIALAERGARGATIALALFTALDLCCYGLSYSIYGRTADLHAFVAQIPAPPEARLSRIIADDAHGLRTGDRMLLAGLNRVDGYAGLEPAKRLDYRSPAAQCLAGVRWVFSPDLGEQGKWRWISNKASVRRARLVSETAVCSKASEIDSLSPAIAAVDRPLVLPPSRPGSTTVIRDTPGKIEISTQAPARQLLVTTESFHRGWRAVIDDHVEPVLRVNGDFLGCVLEAGEHQVCLQFRPQSRRLGGVISACGLGLMLCTYYWRRRRVPTSNARI